MATIIFDFDDTLFNTQKLKDDTFNRLSCFNLGLKVIRKTYSQALDNKKNYTILNHAKILEKKHNLNITHEMKDWVRRLDYASYVFPETKKILKELSKSHYLVLLTKGNQEFQNTKIKKTKLKKYFNEIHIIEDEKEVFLKNKKYNHPIYFVNDKKLENQKIKNKFPKIIIKEKNKGDPIW